MKSADWIRRLWKALPARTVIALAIAAVAVMGFVEIAENVVQDEASGFDHAVTDAVRALDSGIVDVVMRALTLLGSGPFVLAVVALVAGWAVLTGARAPAGVLIAVASVAEALNLLLKHVFQRARPDLPAEIALPSSYSFPSGHAMSAVASFGMATVVIGRFRPRLRAPLAVVAPLLIVGIGTSRVYLGVHWPTDVLAGFAAGALVLVAGALALGPRASGGA